MYTKGRDSNDHINDLIKSNTLINILKQAHIITEDDKVATPKYKESDCIVEISDIFVLPFAIKVKFGKECLSSLSNYEFTGNYYSILEPAENGFLITFEKDEKNPDNYVLKFSDVSWDFSLSNDKLDFILKEKKYSDENKKSLEARK